MMVLNMPIVMSVCASPVNVVVSDMNGPISGRNRSVSGTYGSIYKETATLHQQTVLSQFLQGREQTVFVARQLNVTAGVDMIAGSGEVGWKAP